MSPRSAVLANPATVEAEGGSRNLYEARIDGPLLQVVVEFSADPPVIITLIAPEEE